MVNQNSIELFQISLQENLAQKIPTEMKATCDFLPELIHFEEIRPSVELNPAPHGKTDQMPNLPF